MEASTLIEPKITEAVTTVVPVVAHGPLEHGTYEATVDGKTVARCRLYRNLECHEHVATHDGLKPYQGTGRFRIPFTVWIDPEGKQLFRRDGWRRPDEFMLDIRTALEKVTGARKSKAEYTALVKPLDEGSAALAAQRYAEAAEKFEQAKNTEVEDVRRAAEAGLAQVRAFGDAVLTAAKAALKAGRTRQARPALDTLARELPNLPCGREALDLLRKLPFPLRSLAYRAVDENVGGSTLYLRGDGTCTVQVVTLDKSRAIQQEKRFEFTLDAAAWDELAKLFEGRNAGSPAGPLASSPLKVRMWTGESVGHEPQAGLEVVHAWITARIASASGGRVKFEGTFDPAWRPTGFPE